MKIYLAGPLFTAAEQAWLRELSVKLQKTCELLGCPAQVVWPHDLVSQEDLQRWGDRAKHEIFDRCCKHLDDTDVLVALLDGTQVDDGTAWEIGYFYARKKKRHRILGIRTDFRKSGDVPNAQVNLMIDCTCDVIVNSVDDLLKQIVAEKEDS